jgi:hypothetical protein
VMFGPLSNSENEALEDVRPRELAVLGPILLMIVVMGVYPEPFLAKMEPSVKAILGRAHATRMAATETAVRVASTTPDSEDGSPSCVGASGARAVGDCSVEPGSNDPRHLGPQPSHQDVR